MFFVYASVISSLVGSLRNFQSPPIYHKTTQERLKIDVKCRAPT